MFASSMQVPWRVAVDVRACTVVVGWSVQVSTVDCVVLHRLARVLREERELAAAWQILRVLHTRVCVFGCCAKFEEGFSQWPLLLCRAGLHLLPSHCTSGFGPPSQRGVQEDAVHPPHTVVLPCIKCCICMCTRECCCEAVTLSAVSAHTVSSVCFSRDRCNPLGLQTYKQGQTLDQTHTGLSTSS